MFTCLLAFLLTTCLWTLLSVIESLLMVQEQVVWRANRFKIKSHGSHTSLEEKTLVIGRITKQTVCIYGFLVYQLKTISDISNFEICSWDLLDLFITHYFINCSFVWNLSMCYAVKWCRHLLHASSERSVCFVKCCVDTGEWTGPLGRALLYIFVVKPFSTRF